MKSNEFITGKQFRFDVNSPQRSIIELLCLQAKEDRKGIIQEHTMFFVTTGECSVRTEKRSEKILHKNSAFFLPAGTYYHLECNEKSNFVIFKIDPFQKLNGCYSIEELHAELKKMSGKEDCVRLVIHRILKIYLNNLETYIRDGFISDNFFDIKVKELMFLLSHYYSKSELALFLKPVLNTDPEFASFVLNNWQLVKTARELARLSVYCETSFGKKFKQVFGVSPYKWLNQKRSAQIYYEISNTTKPFKVIAEEFRFNSQQHLNDYCFRHFHLSPGGIRRKQR